MKITLPVSIVGILLLTVGAYAAWRVHRLHVRSADILSVNVAGIRAAEDLETIVREIRYRLRQAIATGESDQLDHVTRLVPQCAQQLRELRRLATTVRERQLVERIERGYQRFAQTYAETKDQLDTQQRTLNSLADEVLPNKVLVYAQKYAEANKSQAAKSRQRVENTARNLIIGLLLLGTTGGAAGLLAGYGIARGVSRTLVQLSFPVRDVAGQLNEVVGPLTVSADPSFRGLEAILQRISERVAQIIDRLQQSQREVLRAEQLAALGQLAAGLAHELRNPLTAMKAIVDTSDPQDLNRRDLAVLREETARLEQSVQAFLDFARPPQPHRSSMDVRELVEQVVALVSPRARRRGIAMHYERPAEPVLADIDAFQVRQVILNLWLNSLDAVSNGGTVWMELSSVGPSVMIRIGDDGCGLPPDLGDRIFEPFVSTKETGIGLGLSICRRIVEAHGGSVRAAARSEGGSVFCVELPIQSCEPSSRESCGASGPEPTVREPSLSVHQGETTCQNC